jgi:hypothetical protein
MSNMDVIRDPAADGGDCWARPTDNTLAITPPTIPSLRCVDSRYIATSDYIDAGNDIQLEVTR